MRAEPARLLYRQLTESLGTRVGNCQVLTMARRLWREGARLPGSLSGLYEAFLQVAGASLTAELREGLLPNLAFFMSAEDRISIRRQHLEEASRHGKDVLPRVDFGKGGPDELLTELSKTRLLRGPNAFTFPSIGFQEFLTATAMRSLSIDRVVELIPPAHWDPVPSEGDRPENLRRGPFHGAVVFLSGLIGDGSHLVRSLIGCDLLLAAQCYREARSKTSVVEELRSAIRHSMSSQDPLLQRVGCLSLEAVADRWAVGVLEHTASNPSSPARAQALEALGKLRSHSSVPLLKAAVLEKDPIVARAALDALGRIKIASGQ